MSMTFRDFESQVVPVKSEPNLGALGMLLYQSNGLAGEAGEVCNNVKKVVRDGAEFEPVLMECGDVLFYMKRLLRMRGYTIEDAGHVLIIKLERIRLGLEQ